MWQKHFYFISIALLLIVFVSSIFWASSLYFLILVIPLIIIGVADSFSKNNVLYNYPLIGHIRYVMEFISPEIRQYFLEDDKSGRPYNRQQRELIKMRAHGMPGTHPFGTEQDIKKEGFDFILHSMAEKKVPPEASRIMIGGPQCKQPYSSSRLNISAMSFGALSSQAVLAMNKGAKLGGFLQDTGEGGLTDYHLRYEADIVWEIASGYFGCRTKEGRFDDEEFRKKANQKSIKMIAIKLSQGAKPGDGGLLPGKKVTKEIAKYRDIPEGKDCQSPAIHPEFSTPRGLLEFIVRLRTLCEGKPVGFKLCIGRRSDFLGICKAMLETGILPDFITIDGAEGGTGAAPSEFSDYVGLALDEAIPFVHSSLVGCNLRQHIKILVSGKIVDGFDMVKKIALGADFCNVARPMMFAVGCIQALRCDTGHCPTGVTTQDPKRAKAIDIDTKAVHVKNYHHETIKSFLQIVGTLGVDHPDKLHPSMIWHRLGNQRAKNYTQLYDYLQPGALLSDSIPDDFARDWHQANANHYFNPIPENSKA
ncbi:glutamate synthase [Legionella steelei]|uniref:Glutamate synthase n=1 Tax=Legionella steelei TaxID=947033 RepID=A0A0W0ZCX1_9GAMM|nr:FMN-binding glutamate synthase family protein [Legionella steelei]KTD66884.1 glutamate synthase [Legionella steelei]